MNAYTVFALPCHSCKRATVYLYKWELDDHGHPYCRACLDAAARVAQEARAKAEREVA